jgi:hypothetical protein
MVVKKVVWRNPYLKIIIVIFVLLFSTSCIRFGKHHPSDKEIMQTTSQFDSTHSIRYRRAYYQGMQDAKKEIKETKLTVYIAGLIPPQSNMIDKETGLPMRMVGGCLINDSLDGLIQGHNEIIKEFIENRKK